MKTELTLIQFQSLVAMARADESFTLPCRFICMEGCGGSLEVCGASIESGGLPVSPARSWMPGVFAVTSGGVVLMAVGGNAYDGADHWQPVTITRGAA